jgi:F0F1-type ATP synthase assembly protein I
MANSGKKWVQFSQLGLQMGLTIAGFVYLGSWLDKKYNGGSNLWVIILALLGVFAAMYIAIKQILRITKEDDEE